MILSVNQQIIAKFYVSSKLLVLLIRVTLGLHLGASFPQYFITFVSGIPSFGGEVSLGNDFCEVWF